MLDEIRVKHNSFDSYWRYIVVHFCFCHLPIRIRLQGPWCEVQVTVFGIGVMGLMCALSCVERCSSEPCRE